MCTIALNPFHRHNLTALLDSCVAILSQIGHGVLLCVVCGVWCVLCAVVCWVCSLFFALCPLPFALCSLLLVVAGCCCGGGVVLAVVVVGMLPLGEESSSLRERCLRSVQLFAHRSLFELLGLSPIDLVLQIANDPLRLLFLLHFHCRRHRAEPSICVQVPVVDRVPVSCPYHTWSQSHSGRLGLSCLPIRPTRRSARCALRSRSRLPALRLPLAVGLLLLPCGHGDAARFLEHSNNTRLNTAEHKQPAGLQMWCRPRRPTTAVAVAVAVAVPGAVVVVGVGVAVVVVSDAV